MCVLQNGQDTASSLKVAFAVTEIGPDTAAGDYFTALELGTVLEARGWQIDYRPKGHGWYDLADVDLLIVMVEEYELPCIRNAAAGLVKVAWARNWFERWGEHPWLADYDLHLASSKRAADFMSRRIGKRVRQLRIATNPERFTSDGRPATPALDYVFTGSYWQSQRDVVAALSVLPRHFRGAIYGKHWEQVPELSHLNRGFVPYGQIHEVYRQAAIVIDDANHVTKDWGAANSRVFDALAAGCLVITNAESVSQDVFDGRLPVYRSPDELAALLAKYRDDADGRNRLVDELRGMVLRQHCYSHRAFELGMHLRSMGMQAASLRAVAPASAAAPSRAAGSATQVPGPPSASFVIPLFNHLAETREMLASLQASLPLDLDYEIILVDDGSTDGTRDWLNGVRDARIRVHLNGRNLGYAAANNVGVSLARGEMVGLLNNDLLFAPGWLEPMRDALLSPDHEAGVVGNVQYRVADGTVDHAGVCLTPDGQLHHVHSLSLTGRSRENTLAVTGACMLLRKADFDAVGGFDEQYRNGCEDIDLCFKLRALGKKVYLANDSRIRHHVSLSRKTNELQDIRNGRRLFARWRKEIKQELSAVWRNLLAAGPAAYADKVSGRLAPDFLSTPHMASQVIAEAMLQREESSWARSLGEAGPDADPAGRVTARGLRYSPLHGGHLLEGSAEFVCDGLRCARNFYVCGHRIDDLSRSIVLTISANGLQALSMPLEAERNLNVGIIDPLLLPGIPNRFQVEVNGAIVLTHVVIDDQVVNL